MNRMLTILAAIAALSSVQHAAAVQMASQPWVEKRISEASKEDISAFARTGSVSHAEMSDMSDYSIATSYMQDPKGKRWTVSELTMSILASVSPLLAAALSEFSQTNPVLSGGPYLPLDGERDPIFAGWSKNNAAGGYTSISNKAENAMQLTNFWSAGSANIYRTAFWNDPLNPGYFDVMRGVGNSWAFLPDSKGSTDYSPSGQNPSVPFNIAASRKWVASATDASISEFARTNSVLSGGPYLSPDGEKDPHVGLTNGTIYVHGQTLSPLVTNAQGVVKGLVKVDEHIVFANSTNGLGGRISDGGTSTGMLVSRDGKEWQFGGAESDYSVMRRADVDAAVARMSAYYITSDQNGSAFSSLLSLTNAGTVYYSGGKIRDPQRNDYAVVLSDESHGGAEWRYIFAESVTEYATNTQWEAQYPISNNNYDSLASRPQINGVTLGGTNNTAKGLGLIGTGGGTITGPLQIGESDKSPITFDFDAGYTPYMTIRDATGNFLVLAGNHLYYQQYDVEYGAELFFPTNDGTFALTSDIAVKSVKRNGTALTPDSAGAVNVEVPTPIAPSTDPSAQGKPADAKATGDALAGKLSTSGGQMTGEINFVTEGIDKGYLSGNGFMDPNSSKYVHWPDEVLQDDTFAIVSQIPDISGKADAADLRYRIAEAAKVQSGWEVPDDLFPIGFTYNGTAYSIPLSNKGDVSLRFAIGDTYYLTCLADAVSVDVAIFHNDVFVSEMLDVGDTLTFNNVRPVAGTTSLDPAFVYALADRAVNLITATTETSIDIVLPAVQAGHSRDFYLAVTCGSTAPTLNAPTTGVTLVNAKGEEPDLTLTPDATTVLRFTEVKEADPTEPAVFCVTGGANGGGSGGGQPGSGLTDEQLAAIDYSMSNMVKDEYTRFEFVDGTSTNLGIYGMLDESSLVAAGIYEQPATWRRHPARVKVGNAVTDIEPALFAVATGLRDAELSRSMKKIPAECFIDCTALSRVTIPDGIEIVGSNSFAYCEALSELVIPSSVTNIEAGAFYGTSLINVTVFGKTASEATNLLSSAFVLPDDSSSRSHGGTKRLRNTVKGRSVARSDGGIPQSLVITVDKTIVPTMSNLKELVSDMPAHELNRELQYLRYKQDLALYYLSPWNSVRSTGGDTTNIVFSCEGSNASNYPVWVARVGSMEYRLEYLGSGKWHLYDNHPSGPFEADTDGDYDEKALTFTWFYPGTWTFSRSAVLSPVDNDTIATSNMVESVTAERIAEALPYSIRETEKTSAGWLVPREWFPFSYSWENEQYIVDEEHARLQVSQDGFAIVNMLHLHSHDEWGYPFALFSSDGKFSRMGDNVSGLTFNGKDPDNTASLVEDFRAELEDRTVNRIAARGDTTISVKFPPPSRFKNKSRDFYIHFVVPPTKNAPTFTVDGDEVFHSNFVSNSLPAIASSPVSESVTLMHFTETASNEFAVVSEMASLDAVTQILADRYVALPQYFPDDPPNQVLLKFADFQTNQFVLGWNTLIPILDVYRRLANAPVPPPPPNTRGNVKSAKRDAGDTYNAAEDFANFQMKAYDNFGPVTNFIMTTNFMFRSLGGSVDEEIFTIEPGEFGEGIVKEIVDALEWQVLNPTNNPYSRQYLPWTIEVPLDEEGNEIRPVDVDAYNLPMLNSRMIMYIATNGLFNAERYPFRDESRKDTNNVEYLFTPENTVDMASIDFTTQQEEKRVLEIKGFEGASPYQIPMKKGSQISWVDYPNIENAKLGEVATMSPDDGGRVVPKMKTPLSGGFTFVPKNANGNAEILPGSVMIGRTPYLVQAQVIGNLGIDGYYGIEVTVDPNDATPSFTWVRKNAENDLFKAPDSEWVTTLPLYKVENGVVTVDYRGPFVIPAYERRRN